MKKYILDDRKILVDEDEVYVSLLPDNPDTSILVPRDLADTAKNIMEEEVKKPRKKYTKKEEPKKKIKEREKTGGRARIPDGVIENAVKEVESGMSVDEVCELHGISTFTFYTRRKKLGKGTVKGVNKKTMGPHRKRIEGEMVNRKPISDEEMRKAIKEVEDGKSINEVIKKYEMSAATFYNRRKKLTGSVFKKSTPDESTLEMKEQTQAKEYGCTCGRTFTSTQESEDIRCPDCSRHVSLIDRK